MNYEKCKINEHIACSDKIWLPNLKRKRIKLFVFTFTLVLEHEKFDD